MDVRAAAAKARTYFADAFDGEELWEIEMEEVAFDHERDVWKFTIGFRRPWDVLSRDGVATQADLLSQRSYKTLRIDDGTGALLDMTHRMMGSPEDPMSVTGPPPRPVLD